MRKKASHPLNRPTRRTNDPGVTTIVMVANRLPVTITRNAGKWVFERSSGGLVSALRGLSNIRMIRVGWPGHDIHPDDQDYVREELEKIDCFPVFLPHRLANQFYNGFSNNVLWPLFHYIPLTIDQLQDASDEYGAYVRANKMFADTVLEYSLPNDVIWVHDYHLMMLPGILRRERAHQKIGFFPTHPVS